MRNILAKNNRLSFKLRVLRAPRGSLVSPWGGPGHPGAQNTPEYKCTGLPRVRGTPVHLLSVVILGLLLLLRGSCGALDPSWQDPGGSLGSLGGAWGLLLLPNIDSNIGRNLL